MTVQVKMLVLSIKGEQIEINPTFAGCRDELDARAKARERYERNIVLIHSTKKVKD